MNAKQMAALCSCLGLTLSGAVHADNAANDSMMRSGSNKQMPFFEQGTTPLKQSDMQMKEQMDPNKMGQFPAAYNQAGSTRLAQDAMDFWVDGSFIYWMVSSDGFNVAQFPVANAISGTVGDPPVPFAFPTGVGFSEFIKPKFKPGFKVAAGFDTHFDDWVVMAEWTWLHESEHTNLKSDSGNELFTSNFPASASSTTTTTVGPTNISAKWKNNMDLVDFGMSRCFYVGQRVTLNPWVGVRGAWFKERLSLNLSQSPTSGSPYAQGVVKTKSWAVGPRIALDSQWILGGGFRVDGRAAGSLLFTRYTKLNYDASSTVLSAVYNTIDLDLGNSGSCSSSGKYDTMRPNAELGLGFGWGSYFGDGAYHFDIAARYDMQVFWDQEMLRTVIENVQYSTGWNPRDLFYQGPTVTVRFDF